LAQIGVPLELAILTASVLMITYINSAYSDQNIYFFFYKKKTVIVAHHMTG